MLFGGVKCKAANNRQWIPCSARISLGNGTRREALLGKPAVAPGAANQSQIGRCLTSASQEETAPTGAKAGWSSSFSLRRLKFRDLIVWPKAIFKSARF
jgi:hypothetical protein